jgi:cysteine desulfurase
MPLYLDHNATTRLDERVVEAMMPYLREHHGNPSSVHRYGRMARAAVDRAREQVAELAGASPAQVLFTGGGTESNNLAIKGVARAAREPGRILIGATEHPSVARSADSLAKHGWRIDRLAVDAEGRVDTERYRAALRGGAALVSVMTANNETGVLQDISVLSAVAAEARIPFHTDAVQAVGKIGVDFVGSGAQLMSLSAHKICGPKGVGALVVDASIELEPLCHGGGQEKGARSGTENVAGIVGFGMAAVLAGERLAAHAKGMRLLRDRLEAGLRDVEGAVIFSAGADRLPNTTSFAVDGVEGETLLMALDRAGMAVSSGSACGSGRSEPNPVLVAMGVEADRARGSIRVSFGKGNTPEDVDAFLAALAGQLRRVRGMTHRALA